MSDTKLCSKCKINPRINHSWCKTCDSTYKHDLYTKKKNSGVLKLKTTRRVHSIVDGYKFCTLCHKNLSIVDFPKNSKSSFGVDPRCKNCKNAYARNKWSELRVEVLSYYSKGIPTCACCGERTIQFLSIDHVEGNGNAHIRSLKNPSRIMQWLKKNNYPQGFRILCHNCNLSIGFYGSCPHSVKLKAVV